MKIHKEITEETGSALKIQTNLHKVTVSELWFIKSLLKSGTKGILLEYTQYRIQDIPTTICSQACKRTQIYLKHSERSKTIVKKAFKKYWW